MRINVIISDELNGKLDFLSGRWGCSKSDLVAVVLGQYLDEFDTTVFLKNERLERNLQKFKKDIATL